MMLILSDTTLCSADDLLVKLMYKVLTVEERMDNLETQFQSAFDGLNARLDKMTDLLRKNNASMDSEVSDMEEAITTAVTKIVQSQYTVLKNFMKVEKQMLSETKHQLNANVTNLNTVIEQALLIYDETLADVESQVKSQGHQLSEHSNQLKTTQRNIRVYQSSCSSVSDRVDALENKTDDVESQATSQGHQLSEHSNQLSTTQRNLRIYQSSCSSVSDRMDALENKTGSFVSFSTRLTNTLPETAIGTIIKFNEVINNYGSHYSNSTGKFTAPVSGIYVFTFYIGTHTRGTINQAHLGLYVDGTLQMTAVSHSTSGNIDSGGNSVILQLAKGQEVYIKTYTWPDKHDIWGWWTTFSGALLYAI